MSIGRIVMVMILAAAALVVMSLAGTGRRAQGPEVLGEVADFSLTERSGQTITKNDLHGKVWVGAFFFTCCTQSCPQITATLGQLQGELAREPDVLLVSFSVYPEHDTPEVLRTYADRNQADARRWLFLTGKEDDVFRLCRQSFELGVEPNTGANRTPGNEVLHSNKLTLVDRHGRIRGRFNATVPDEVDQLRKTIPLLLRERR